MCREGVPIGGVTAGSEGKSSREFLRESSFDADSSMFKTYVHVIISI